MIRKLIVGLIVYTACCAVVSSQNCYGYDNKVAHRYINKKAVEDHSTISEVLKTLLDFNEGIDAKIKGKIIGEWIREGGYYEDEPESRCLRHFHDPLNSNWDSAGLLSLYRSMIHWAQAPSPAGSNGLWNEYSWSHARQFYHQALVTGSEEQYANTFRAVGQLMHLISDAAVPAHVRDDAHPKVDLEGITIIDDSDPYENWVQALLSGSLPTHSIEFENYTVDPAIFDKAIINPIAPSPVSALWDHDEYTYGSGVPDDSNPSIGLAEYTNANFWTEGTFPWEDQSGNYPHPTLDDLNYDENVWFDPVSIDAEDGVLDNRIYLSKKSDPIGTPFLSAGYWSCQLYKWNKPEFKYTFLLDEKCFEQSAKKLIPRAIGYSAALLDYFFRGSIKIALPINHYHSGAYAISTDPDQGFTPISISAMNTSGDDEEMTDGSIELVVRYKLALDDPFQSGPIPTTNEWCYITASETNNTRTIPNDRFEKLEFELDPPIPIHATDVTINLVYRGVLGRESDGIAVGYRDIREPTPIDIFSNLDKVCLSGTWLDAGSQEAIDLVDTNANGISDRNEVDVYPHDLKDIYLRICSMDDPQTPARSEDDIYVPELHAGEFKRVAYILSDQEFHLSAYYPWSVCTHPSDDHQGVSANTMIVARNGI